MSLARAAALLGLLVLLAVPGECRAGPKRLGLNDDQGDEPGDEPVAHAVVTRRQMQAAPIVISANNATCGPARNVTITDSSPSNLSSEETLALTAINDTVVYANVTVGDQTLELPLPAPSNKTILNSTISWTVSGPTNKTMTIGGITYSVRTVDVDVPKANISIGFDVALGKNATSVSASLVISDVKLFLTLTVNPVNSSVDDTITVSIFPSIGLQLCQSLVPSSYEYSYYGTEYSYDYPSGGSGGTGGSDGYSGGSGQYYT